MTEEKRLNWLPDTIIKNIVSASIITKNNPVKIKTLSHSYSIIPQKDGTYCLHIINYFYHDKPKEPDRYYNSISEAKEYADWHYYNVICKDYNPIIK